MTAFQKAGEKIVTNTGAKSGAPPILIVDDDEDSRDLLCGFLREKNFCVVSAVNGREALDYLRSGNPLPSLILLDLNMPVMDGFAFRKEQLASNDGFANVPVIVMSALPPTESTGMRVKDVLTKPISLPLLMAAIRRTGT
ncbi:MAG: response regulator [Polyangiaceae bacterium]